MKNNIDLVLTNTNQNAETSYEPEFSGSYKENYVNEVHHVNQQLTEKESKQEELAKQIAMVESIVERAKNDAGLYASNEFKHALKFIREHDNTEWVRLRVLIMKESPRGIKQSDIDDATRPDSELSGSRNVADSLVDLVVSRCELFYDESTRDAFVTTTEKNETFKVGGMGFSDWLNFEFYTASGSSASETAVKQAAATLSGLCKFSGTQERVFLRAARFKASGAYYLFMSNEKNQAIEITPTGWRITDKYPVKFWKPSSQKSLPVPVPDGNLNRLWEFCNIPELDRPLVLAWLLECFRVDTPFILLEVNGLQGSAKSSTQDKLRRLIDPCTSNLRQSPKSIEDVFVNAGNNWIVSYENLSFLPPKIQDALCSMSTGGAAGGRTLYTNGEEFLIELKRPCVINGIPSLVTAQDLTQRTIHLELPGIELYRKETELDAAFEDALPEIMGGLLDLFQRTLSHLPKVVLVKPPRMVDFCALGEAMMQSQGEDDGAFSLLYAGNRADSVLRSIEASPVASAIIELADDCAFNEVFHGTYNELLDMLLPYKRDNLGWVSNAKGLANAIKRQIPAMQEAGLIVIPEQGPQQNKRGRFVTIRKDVHGVFGVHDLDKKVQTDATQLHLINDGSPF